jgi:hypothetical protein
MQAMTAIGVFVATAIFFQFLGFLVSRGVASFWPAAGLLTLLILFLAAYGITWPIAVRIAEWLIVRLGYDLQQVDPRSR